MKPLRLYIENFMCYERGFIDFTQFSSALIVGKRENNDHYSNGVGKTTIFKAIEYVLFNQSDVNLEKIIRDDASSCQVVMDFLIGNQEYRLSRTRTKKGSTDLTLLQRNSQTGPELEVYHNVTESPWLDKKYTEKYWKDLSGSRAGDTEKDLAKLIKVNHKSFLSTSLFPQNDMAGLPTATPEKRKGILKEALNLIVYTKLEKLAKDKTNIITKDIDKNRILLESLGDPQQDLDSLKIQLHQVKDALSSRVLSLSNINAELAINIKKVNDLTNLHSNLEGKFASLLVREKSLSLEKNKLEISVKEYQSKKSNAAKSAKDIINEISALKEIQTKLIEIDYSQIDILNEQINALKEQVVANNISITTNIEKFEELKIPMPANSVCKHCRQPMTDLHKQECQAQIAKDMLTYQASIQSSKKIIATVNAEILKHQQTINSLNLSRQQLDSVNTKITAKNREVVDKKSLYAEYSALLKKFMTELEEKTLEVESVMVDLKSSSLEEANIIKAQIGVEQRKIDTITSTIALLNKEITHFNNNEAVIQHSIDQKVKDNVKFNSLKTVMVDLDAKLKMYPSVLQAFSSTGIPNLIIQNVLDDLQIEANNLLTQLKPGLQLAFSIEKTVEKTGDQADTLDITYQVNGKDRYYKQLSGAMQLAVAFSLKLGLSFLLQKMIGTDIKFLLLDEIDQSLDKASVDAFADIVKFFQKDFVILIITHNDRLKDKFSHAILVEQDINMVSGARVVSSW
jgi:DNA repair exonuclease SbcCD ATPase subunit